MVLKLGCTSQRQAMNRSLCSTPILFSLALLLFWGVFFLSSATAGQTIIHHQAHGTLIIHTEKPSAILQSENLSVQWSFPQTTVVSLNLLLTHPGKLLTRDTSTTVQHDSMPPGGYRYQITTTTKKGGIDLTTEGRLLGDHSYVETIASNTPWTVVIKRSEKYGYNEAGLVNPFAGLSDATPETIKTQLVSGSSCDEYKGDPKRKPKGKSAVGEIGAIATLFGATTSNNNEPAGIIYVIISTDEGEYYDLISFDEWRNLQQSGNANLTGLLNLIRTHITEKQEYHDSIGLIDNILERQEQGITFERDNHLLSSLLNELKPPRQIEILAADSPPLVYLGKKKNGATASGGSDKEKSKTPPATHAGTSKKESTTLPSLSREDEIPPPPPPGATALTKPARIVSELDIKEIIISSGTHVQITQLPFIMQLFSANLLPWSIMIELASQAGVSARNGDVMAVALLNTIISIASQSGKLETKLLFLRLLHASLLATSNQTRIDALLKAIPGKYHSSVTSRHTFSTKIFREMPSSQILRQLIVYSTLIPGTAEQLLESFSEPPGSPYSIEGRIIELLRDINLPTDLTRCWDHLKQLLSNGMFATVADIPKEFTSEIEAVQTRLSSKEGKPFTIPDFEFIQPIVSRFSPITPEFRIANALAQSLLKGNQIKSKLGNMTVDETLMTLALAVHKLKKDRKISDIQALKLQQFLNMLFQTSRGFLPEVVVSISELALTLGIQETASSIPDTVCYSPTHLSASNLIQINALLVALIEPYLKVYQYFNTPAARQLAYLFEHLGRNVVEIGAGHGMLSSALTSIGFSVQATTDLYPLSFPFFRVPIIRKSALKTIKEYGSTPVYIIASPDKNMMKDILASGHKAMFILLGSQMQSILNQAANAHQIPLVLSDFHPMRLSHNMVLLLNFDEAEVQEIEGRIPKGFTKKAKRAAGKKCKKKGK